MSIRNKDSSSALRLERIDWDYSGDRSDSRFSGLHFHPGRLISQIPAALIGRLTQVGDVVLDPFCGSGTSLIEAQRLGRRSIGIDINPVAATIVRAKTIRSRAARVSPILDQILADVLRARISLTGEGEIPSSVQLLKWYHAQTATELRRLWLVRNGLVGIRRQLFEFCFTSILMSACSETRHWGYVCDNTQPKTKNYNNAFDLIEHAIERLRVAYVERDESLPQGVTFPLPDVEVRVGDAPSMMRMLPANVAALIVTSPPYFGVVDYVKAQRLAMEWLGLSIEASGAREIGARSKRHRKSAYSDYQTHLSAAVVEMARVLRPGGMCCVVLGESSRRPGPVRDFRQLLSSLGFAIEFQTERSISADRRQSPSITSETLFVARKQIRD